MNLPLHTENQLRLRDEKQNKMKMNAEVAVNREKEIQTLKKNAKEIEFRLRFFEKKIRKMEHGLKFSIFQATVDQDKCVSCGICQGICPTGAISIDQVARVDPSLCKGCGLCTKKCPQGAISLHPVGRNYGKMAGDAS